MTHLDTLRDKIPGEVFGDDDLHLICRGLSPSAFYSTLSRLLKQGRLLKVRRGLYVFPEKLRKGPLSLHVVASRLYFPSAVSFESALSFHGLIPEGVYAVTSACPQMKNKIYSTPLGEFTYRPVPEAAFRLGIESIATKSGSFLMANPIKALFDLTYAKKRVYETLEEVESDLRIDLLELQRFAIKYTFLELETLANSYRKKSCARLLALLMRGRRVRA
ncbi:type IV toxin-antitoxin system AbiEi family antitoxin domain-containing protein [Bdellovibrionota bacterium FG-2]